MTEPSAAPQIIWKGSERPRIPPNVYTARCTGYQGPEWIREFGRWGLRLEFVLDPDDHRVSAFYSFGEDRDTPKIGTRSKYFKDWTRANGGPPKHGQTMSPEAFVNPDLVFTVQVSDAVKDAENTVKDGALVYSRISKILEVKRLSTQEDMQASW